MKNDSHLALYREFRPKNFDEVIGQEQVVKTLTNQIKNGNINHAYLFCGTRGTGKTSCAKIFAKAINCLNSNNGNCCGTCDACKSVGVNGNLDIIEMDAASNNRVDEIRDLREKVKYYPTVGKYKVYIIDEVHMLTDSAFNALLKTLEEPPSFVVFILATTEPHKLPATILSRCMRFDFKLVSNLELQNLLQKIFKEKEIKFEQPALELIARAGEGSVRDTLSVAEMCVAYSNGNITYNSVTQCLGLTDSQILFNLVKAIINKNGKDVLQITNKIYNEGKSLKTLIKDLSKYFANVLTFNLCGSESLNLPLDILNNIKTLNQENISTEFILNCINVLSKAEANMRYCVDEKTFCISAVLSCFYNQNLEIEVLKSKIDKLENNAKSGSVKGVSFNPNTVIIDNVEIQKEKDKITEKIKEKKTIANENVNLNAKKIFGELIVNTRSSKELLLLASLGDVAEVKINLNNLILYCNNNDSVNLIIENKNFINEFLNKYNLTVEVQTLTKTNITDVLNEKFDGKIKIKE